MNEAIPAIGRILQYRLTADNADAINRRRTTGGSVAQRINEKIWPLGAQAHMGNRVYAGDVFPLMITRVWGSAPFGPVNGQVLLDGNDVFWVTSVHGAAIGADLGTYSWPDRI